MKTVECRDQINIWACSLSPKIYAVSCLFFYSVLCTCELVWKKKKKKMARKYHKNKS